MARPRESKKKEPDRKKAAARKSSRRRFGRLSAFDRELREGGASLLAGVDEAGRGALAGPVAAAAVILPFDRDLSADLLEVDDSKTICEELREELFCKVVECATAVGIAFGHAALVDRENILQATLMTMHRAVDGLGVRPDLVVIDGRDTIHYEGHVAAVIKGDSKSLSIAAASIVAKVARDRLMRKLHLQFPRYNFRENKGYGTQEHLDAICAHGVISQHRKTFHLKVVEKNLAMF